MKVLFLGVNVEDLVYGVKGLGLKIEGTWFQGLGFRVHGLMV
jgi:hypothetical protein